ncbi:MAG TPA: plastocyanin/azurin family copper-binding protein [Rickettsiales bacterium]|nr:plastocyanin/azurin family copper-binding protein [Rickettsiales bacterium]
MRKIFFAAVCAVSAMASSAYADVTVDQADKLFSTDQISVKPGDTVHYNNKDTVTHNIKVITPDGDAQDKGLQKPGQAIDVKFDKAGEYEVRCAIHPTMKMTVEVK